MKTTPTIDVIIVGAGSGKRLGHPTPKAFVNLCGNPILYYSLKTFLSHPLIDKTILVVPPDKVDEAEIIISEYNFLKDKVAVTAGGDERWKSVLNGVSLSTGGWVLIHDAARPFVTHAVIDSLLDMRERFDCVITATPEVDTVRMIKDGGRCGLTVDRSTLLRVGTPQMFRREALLSAFDECASFVVTGNGAASGAGASHKKKGLALTDEAALFESLGKDIGFAWGDPMNFKITTEADLDIAAAIIRTRNG